MDRNVIISKVKTKLDELAPFGQGLVVSAVNENIQPIEKYIDDSLDESTEELELTLPIHLLPTISMDVTGYITISDDNIASIKLANDYLRLAYISFPCWERAVTKTVPESSPIYALQKNEYSRGGLAKPVVIIKKDLLTNKKILECYTVTNDAANLVPSLLYVKATPPDSIPDNLIPALTSLCAQKVLTILGRLDLVQIVEAGYVKMLQLLLNT